MSHHWNKLLRAGDHRRTSRFHTARDEWIGAVRSIHFVRASLSWARLRVGGGLAHRPWLSYAAIRRISGLIPREAAALEVGSGMSTLWLAPRCTRLLSIEADQAWFTRLQPMLREAGHHHVRLEWRWQAEHMTDFSSIPDASLDFALIDGGPRPSALRAALPKLRPGGCLYVDNTDERLISESCREDLISHARKHGGKLEIYRDFTPCTLHATEGMLWISPR